MEFDSLLGNKTVKERLSTSLSRGQLSHCYLITGPAGSGKHTLAWILAAAMECTSANKPCGMCPQCRKVMRKTHPDIITIDQPDRKQLEIKYVRTVCSDLYIRPNEGLRKIYLFPNAQKLSVADQNVLLKCIEEPPAYGAFLFLAEHAEQLLPTIRSRCVELQMAPLSQAVLTKELAERYPSKDPATIRAASVRSGGYLGAACQLIETGMQLYPETSAFVRAFCSGTSLEYLRLFVPMEKLKREQLSSILTQWNEVLASALTTRKGISPICQESVQIASSCSVSKIMKAIESVQNAIVMADANVGPGHICGALCIQLQQ